MKVDRMGHSTEMYIQQGENLYLIFHLVIYQPCSYSKIFFFSIQTSKKISIPMNLNIQPANLDISKYLFTIDKIEFHKLKESEITTYTLFFSL